MMSIEELYAEFKAATGVCTDTRKLEKGNIYFALKGASFNGNKFAQQALDHGARLAIIDESDYQTEGTVLVDDALKTLQQLANYHRHQLDIPFIGITGSNGKTTTKELITGVLSTTFKTHATAGNFNNHIGVPLTLLAIPDDTEIAVIEMGANHIGEIEALCNIAHPTHGVITNIGKAHLEGFGSLEGVARGKSELYKHVMNTGGIAFVNSTNEHLHRMGKRLKDVIWYLSEGDYFKIDLLEASPFVTYKAENGTTIKTQLIGAYNFENVATALCIGKFFGVTASDANQAVVDYVPSNNRSQVIDTATNTVILDAYNANPTSMSAAIKNFSVMEKENKLMVLGDMFELGEDSEKEHGEIVRIASELGIEALYCGKDFFKLKTTTSGNFFETRADLVKFIEESDFQNRTILVKGSRGIGLENITEYL